jgi:ribosomal protein S18 acetylase RimI-like enzyme
LIGIRDAKRRDLAEIDRLRRQESRLLGELDSRLTPCAADADMFRQTVEAVLGRRSCAVLVAERSSGEGLAGCIVGTTVDNRPFAVRRYGYIGCLHVDQEGCEAGVGDRLFDALWSRFDRWGVEAAQVDVAHRDRMGKERWEQRGFTPFLDHLCCDAEAHLEEASVKGVAVRQAGQRDMKSVLSLWQEMMDYHAPLDRRLRVVPEERAYVARAIGYWLGDGSSRLLVAEVGGAVIGFALGGLVEVGLGIKSDAYGHIAHICVAADWRRRGIGRQLLATLVHWFRRKEVSSIHIYVSHFSPVSQRFWRSMGFESYIERLWCDR